MVFLAWAHVRTALAVGGIVFVAAGLGSACLDHVGEEVARCEQGGADAGPDCGTAAASPPLGSGSGSAAP